MDRFQVSSEGKRKPKKNFELLFTSVYCKGTIQAEEVGRHFLLCPLIEVSSLPTLSRVGLVGLLDINDHTLPTKLLEEELMCHRASTM